MRRAIAAASVILLVIGIPIVFPGLVSRLVPTMLFYPTRLDESEADPESWGLSGAEQAGIRTADGVELHAWWVPADPAGSVETCGTVMYFHGNAGNLAGRAPIAQAFSRLGFDVLLFDYRGYGLSEGRPSEEGLYLDGEAAYAYVRDGRGVPPGRLVLAGNSLGAAVAISVAERSEAAALVATSSFRTLPELASALYPWLPSRLFRWDRNRFESVERIAAVRMPVFVGWGQRDELMPREQTFGLYEAAPDPKVWFESPTAGHNDLWSESGFWIALDEFLRQTLPC